MSSAQRNLGPSSSRWSFHSWGQCDASGDLQEFADHSSALSWLRQTISDSPTMATLRSLASEHESAGVAVRQMSDDRVLEHVSWLLRQGVLHVHSIPAPATAWRIVQVEQASPSAVSRPVISPKSTSAPPPVPKQIEEPDTFSSQTDAAATAAVLRSAAEDGVPFCEECAKAAAARKAA